LVWGLSFVVVLTHLCNPRCFADDRAALADDAILYTQQEHLEKYVRLTLFRDVVPYFDRTWAFNTKPQAQRTIMALLSKGDILDAILNGQAVPVVGDYFVFVAGQCLLDPPADIVAAWRAADASLLTAMVARFVAHKYPTPGSAVGRNVEVEFVQLVQRHVIFFNGAFFVVVFFFFFFYFFKKINKTDIHTYINRQTCCTNG
jgi:hypothetical protein